MKRRRRGRIVALVLLAILLALSLALLLVRLLVFPRGRYHLPTRPVALETEDGVSLSAVLLSGQSEALVVVLPGFGGSARTPEVIRGAEALAAEFDVLVVDPRGHGGSAGSYPLDFDSTVLDLRAALSWGRQQGYGRVGVLGFSLGGAAAVLEQARYRDVDSVVSVGCPATSAVGGFWGSLAASGAGRLFFRLMGTRVAPYVEIGAWPAEVVHRVAPAPLLVVHGGRDRVVPEENSLALYEAAREPKAYLSLPDQGHARLGEARSEVREWFRRTLLPEAEVPPAWLNVLERRLAEGPPPPVPAERGTLSGTVYSDAGEPLPGAVVLVATETGHTFTGYSDAAGRFQLEAPVGQYVPIATAPGYEAALFRHGAEQRTPVEVTAGEDRGGVDLTLSPHVPLPLDAAAISLTLSPPEEVTAPNPRPVTALRRKVTFEYGGRRVDTCALYEPITATGRLPVILAVYPSEADRWQLVSVPMAAEGYVVLAYGPLYEEKLEELDLPGYGRDLVAAWSLLEGGRLSSHVDPERFGVLTGSIASFFLQLALPDLPQPRVIAAIGGGYDLFLVLRDLYEREDYVLEEPFATGLAALGRPDLYPEAFLQFSMRYSAQNLPPMGLFHSTLDEILLVDQSEEMLATLEEWGRPAHFYVYVGLEHYPGIEDPPPETLQMYREIMETLGLYIGP